MDVIIGYVLASNRIFGLFKLKICCIEIAYTKHAQVYSIKVAHKINVLKITSSTSFSL